MPHPWRLTHRGRWWQSSSQAPQRSHPSDSWWRLRCWSERDRHRVNTHGVNSIYWHIFPNMKTVNLCLSPAHWGPCTFSWRPQQTPRPSWSQTGPGCGRRPPVITFRIMNDVMSGEPEPERWQWVILYFISWLLDDIGPRLLGLVLVPAHHVDRSTFDRDEINIVFYQLKENTEHIQEEIKWQLCVMHSIFVRAAVLYNDFSNILFLTVHRISQIFRHVSHNY